MKRFLWLVQRPESSIRLVERLQHPSESIDGEFEQLGQRRAVGGSFPGAAVRHLERPESCCLAPKAGVRSFRGTGFESENVAATAREYGSACAARGGVRAGVHRTQWRSASASSQPLCGASVSLRESTVERPVERACFESVPMRDERLDDSCELRTRGKTRVSEHSALEDREPELDLIDPRGVNRRVEKFKPTAVALVEPHPSLVAAVVMDVEIVPDNDDASTGMATRDRIEKAHDGGRIAVVNDATEYTAGANIERSEKRAGAMSCVLELAANHAAVANMDWMTKRQSLHGFLVDAEHDRVIGRVHIDVADPPDLRSELRVGAMQPLPNTMRPESFGREDALNRASTNDYAALQLQRVRNGLLGPYRAERDSLGGLRASQANDFATSESVDLLRSS